MTCELKETFAWHLTQQTIYISVARMINNETIANYFSLRNDGMALVAWVAEEGKTYDDLIALDMPDDYATDLIELAELFYGPVSHSRYQKRCRESARRLRFCVETLAVVKQASRNIKDANARWRFREELCRIAGDTQVVRRAARRIKGKYQQKKPLVDGLRTRRVGDKITMSITGPSKDVQPLVTTLKNAKDEEGRPLDPIEWMRTHRPIVQTDITTHAVLSVHDIARVIHGEGDDVLVELTDGTILTGAEVVERELREQCLITLTGPTLGPINTYDGRIATYKQRRACDAESQTCCWPGCNCPSEECEAHHLTEHVRGGETKPENLCWLCPYHNGVNGQKGFGRMERINGRLAWVSDATGKARFVEDERRERRADLAEYREAEAARKRTKARHLHAVQPEGAH